MTAPHLSALISVIHDEDLYRLRHRLLKHKNDPIYLECAQMLTNEIAERETKHEQRAKAVRQT